MDFLNGKIKKEKGLRKAGERLAKCKELLKRHNINFPPFVCGTLNIELNQEFPTPNWGNVILISQEEIDNYEAGYNEWWKLIPAKVIIDGKEIPAFIFRSRQNPHGDKVVELITHNIDLPNGSNIVIRLDRI